MWIRRPCRWQKGCKSKSLLSAYGEDSVAYRVTFTEEREGYLRRLSPHTCCQTYSCGIVPTCFNHLELSRPEIEHPTVRTLNESLTNCSTSAAPSTQKSLILFTSLRLLLNIRTRRIRSYGRCLISITLAIKQFLYYIIHVYHKFKYKTTKHKMTSINHYKLKKNLAFS